MKIFSAEDVAKNLSYGALIKALETAFTSDITCPPRSHFMLDEGSSSNEMLLTMPAWRTEEYIGVKLVTVMPDNAILPTVQGVYQLFSATTGEPLAMIDGPELTARRTAAASALASKYLSKQDSKTHLIIGTGKLAPYFAEAHAAVRPIKNILIYGRSSEKAQATADSIQLEGITVEMVPDLEEAANRADIISTLTTATDPIVKAEHLSKGVHLDLAGAYTATMREADSNVVKMARLFVDTYEGAKSEAGDILIPVKEGHITQDHIVSDLKELITSKAQGRGDDNEITLFKSVGCSLEDYAAAMLLVENTV